PPCPYAVSGGSRCSSITGCILGLEFGILYEPGRAPIAQGIERRPPEPGAEVRILLGAPRRTPFHRGRAFSFLFSAAGGRPLSRRGLCGAGAKGAASSGCARTR